MTMLVALFAKDKSNALQIRKDNREAHLAYIESTGVVSQAGPLLDETGEMAGSLVILDVADMAAAQDWADNDPYAKSGLFDSVELVAWKKVIG
ncbi:YciI family protein [Salipiger mucosus]